MLAHTDTELGIDAELMRPGTERLLEKIAESVSKAECIKRAFKWK